jgi:protein-tyrosine kinase
MSIIEKALSKLGEGGSSTLAEDTVGSARVEVNAENVIQKAATATATATVSDGISAGAVINIPFEKLQKKGMLTPAIPRSAIAEEYRTIKRPLLQNIAGESAAPIDNANLIMVTSALEGDGKTFTSINLAMSIAMEQDKTVLFVDADTAKAEAGLILGVPTALGLIDVLEGKGVALEDVILHTNVEKLRILPAGNLHANSNELLASDAMRKLMTELSQRYSDRVIVFDSPPILLTTEAGVLASFMGQIVFVVKSDSTQQQAVLEALEHIGQDKMVGMVLNQARRRRFNLFGYGYGRDNYGYGYGYGYGNRHRHTQPEA